MCDKALALVVQLNKQQVKNGSDRHMAHGQLPRQLPRE